MLGSARLMAGPSSGSGGLKRIAASCLAIVGLGVLGGSQPACSSSEPDQLCRTFSEGKPAWSSALYRAAFPLTRPLIARANGVVDPANVERAFARSEAALELVAREAGPDGQLVGEAFSLADLVCAALLAPLVSLDHPDMRTPSPCPASLAAFHARFAAHPGVAWVRAQYRLHRPPPFAA